MAKKKVAFIGEGSPFLPADEWEAHKATLARDVDETEWRVLANMYTHASQFRQLFAIGSPQNLTEEQVFLLVDGARRAYVARDNLVGPRV